MPTAEYSYTVRVIKHSPALTRDERHWELQDDISFMESRGWKAVNSSTEISHTATTYRRPAGITSVYLMAQDGQILRTTLD